MPQLKRKKTTSEVGAFIKARRKEHDLTQHQLAFHAKVSFTLVNRIENGDLNVRLESVNRLLKVFRYEMGPVPIKTPPSTEAPQTNG